MGERESRFRDPLKKVPTTTGATTTSVSVTSQEMPETLQVSGKLPGRPPVAAAVGHNQNRLLYAWDRYSRRRFLVDTGAEVSVLPATRADKHSNKQGGKLTATNGSGIRTFGTRTITLQFNKNHFKWAFTIAEVSQPLLGADFLRAHSLLVNIRGKRLIDPHDFASSPNTYNLGN